MYGVLVYGVTVYGVTLYGARQMVNDVMMCDVWCIVHYVWCNGVMVCGVWFNGVMVYGASFMV